MLGAEAAEGYQTISLRACFTRTQVKQGPALLAKFRGGESPADQWSHSGDRDGARERQPGTTGWRAACLYYLAEKGTLFPLTRDEASPPKPQLSHQPFH